MDAVVTETIGTMLTLDLSHPVVATLSKSAERISKLLAAAPVMANSDVQSCLDDFLGAVYAFILARHHKFQDRAGRPIDIKPVAQRATSMATGRVRPQGKWIAGFYFNNALFRTAAVYHRILKIVVGPARKDDVPTLQIEALARFASWNSIKLHKVHSQVNDLKHEPHGIYSGRLVTYDEALTAIDELLKLIEAWASANISAIPKP